VVGVKSRLRSEAQEGKPDTALFNYLLGLACAKDGQAELARQQLERVVKVKPNSREADELQRAMAGA
jgi:Flp pilus assembly protein TadD